MYIFARVESFLTYVTFTALMALVSLASWKKGDAKKDVYRFFIREISLEEVQGSTSHHESRTYFPLR